MNKSEAMSKSEYSEYVESTIEHAGTLSDSELRLAVIGRINADIQTSKTTTFDAACIMISEMEIRKFEQSELMICRSLIQLLQENTVVHGI